MDREIRGFFPRYIDRPRLIGIFEMDEFAGFFFVVIVCMSLSLVSDSIGSVMALTMAMAFGSLFIFLLRKVKKNMAAGYAWQLMYRKGLFHPMDMKQKLLSYPQARKIWMIPYGFTKEFFN